MTDTLQRKYNALYQDYMALKYSDICVRVRRKKIPHQRVRPSRCVTAAARVKKQNRPQES